MPHGRLWVKLGQYLSSRADVMPQEYLDVLGKCQDSLPSRKFDDIKALVEAELRQPLTAVFDHVDEEPIACASIAQARVACWWGPAQRFSALITCTHTLSLLVSPVSRQVHRATLSRRFGGHQVVIKVQHAGVAERLLQDLMNLETIGDTMKRLDPDFDFTPVISEWAKEVPKELDFRQEASNMQTVEANLRAMLPNPRSPVAPELEIDVSFPQVIEGLVTGALRARGEAGGQAGRRGGGHTLPGTTLLH